MIEDGGRPSLAEKSRPAVRRAERLLLEELKRDGPPEPGVLGPIDDAHPTLSQLFDDGVMGDRLTEQMHRAPPHPKAFPRLTIKITTPAPGVKRTLLIRKGVHYIFARVG